MLIYVYMEKFFKNLIYYALLIPYLETARLVGLGVDIYPGSKIRENSDSTNELIFHADGFAQVLPRDKREVVEVLKRVYNRVVGMTGDGVNDAPALSAAQVGIGL